MKTNSLIPVLVMLLVSLALSSCGPDVPAIKPIVDMSPVANAIEFLSKCAVLITLLIGGFKVASRKT